jgi:NADH-quinone oxidoreductase subunit L
LNKYYVDEIYETVFVRFLRRLGDLCFALDNWVIDSILWFITAVPRALGALAGLTQRGILQSYALWMILGLALTLILVIYSL